MIKRRRMLFAFAMAAAAAPISAFAQQAKKVRRIGYLSMSSPEADRAWLAAFRQGLRELGYVEGENIVIDVRHAVHQVQKVSEFAIDMVRREVEVIVVYGSPALPALMKSGRPIVMTTHADPVGAGVIASLARPGGNITGFTDGHADLGPKRLELLKEAVPSASRVGALFNPATSHAVRQLKLVNAAAPQLGMKILPFEMKSPEDIDPLFGRIGKERIDAIFIIPDPSWSIGQEKRLSDHALKRRLPAIGTIRQFAENGILLSYGTNFAELWRRSATYVDKILKGAKPADLPVEHPTRFELVVNLRTAKAIGIRIPQSILLRADSVIE